MNKWTIGKKLIVGFTILSTILAVIGGVSYFSSSKGLESIKEVGVTSLPSVQTILVLNEALTDVDRYMRTLAITGLSYKERLYYYGEMAKIREETDASIKKYKTVQTSAEGVKRLEKIQNDIGAARDVASKYMELQKKLDKDYEVYSKSARSEKMDIFAAYNSALDYSNEANIQIALAFSDFSDALMALSDPKAHGDALSAFKANMDKAIANLKNVSEICTDTGMQTGEAEKLAASVSEIKEKAISEIGKLDKANPNAAKELDEKTTVSFKNCLDMNKKLTVAINGNLSRLQKLNVDALAIFLNEYTPLRRAISKMLGSIADEESGSANKTAMASIKSANMNMTLSIVIPAAAILIAIGLATLITKGVNRDLQGIASILASGAEQTTNAAGQISAASQSLADASSRQASSLEETSASLEEMSSMTHLSSDNADKAKVMSANALNGAQRGVEAMGRMGKAIEDIKKSSDSTAKIVKTIDEIAFQTNLLALNAAVEAARAGEAGKGFAVVAEEVRALAQRSAEAAKATASMIEESVKNATNGVSLSSEVFEVFKEIAEHAKQVDTLVAEIASASKEQSQGIGQINTAVSEMDKTTQANAATAEEAASASEELNAQAMELNVQVKELLKLVGITSMNTTGFTSHHRTIGMHHDVMPAAKAQVKAPAAAKSVAAASPRKAVASAEKPKITPQEVIPLDNDDF